MKQEQHETKSKAPFNNKEVIEGYNPNTYRFLSLLFVVIAVLNIVIVTYSFYKIGYGLWHAENALSYIANINNSYETINNNVLMIRLYPDNTLTAFEKIDNIAVQYQVIQDNASKFREINTAEIDKDLPAEFESTISVVENYYTEVYKKLLDIRDGNEKVSALKDIKIEGLQKEATASIQNLFEKQDKATYAFFWSVAQRFLLVLLSLLLTMVAGLFAVSQTKKRNYLAAVRLQENKKKAEKARQKVQDVAYTNILTGFGNRYALFEYLNEIKAKDFHMAMYRITNFTALNERYGRNLVDEYISAISEGLKSKFGDSGKIFCTESNEFCVVFNNEILKARTSIVAQSVLDYLLQPVSIGNNEISAVPVGCVYRNNKNYASTIDEMFIAMDRGLGRTNPSLYEGNLITVGPVHQPAVYA